MGTVVALGGQVGGAKLAEGLGRLRGGKLTVIVNTGDDYEYLGLQISPDVDTMLYALAGIADANKGWEPAGESFACHGMLTRLGGPVEVPLGDRALAGVARQLSGVRRRQPAPRCGHEDGHLSSEDVRDVP